MFKFLVLCLLSLSLTSWADTMPNTVSIVLVHGAYADASSWSKVIPELQAKGYQVIAVQNPLTSLDDDVAATNRAISNATGKVVLVGHSWGGAVITTAGQQEKVAALVYVAALAPAVGESYGGVFSRQPATPGTGQTVLDSFGFATLTAQGMSEDFAPDLSASDASVMFATQGPISAKSFDRKISTSAWKNKPVWSVIADDDRMIDPALETSTAERANAKITHVKSSHVVMLSHPDEVTNVIVEAADQVSGVHRK